MRVLQPGYGCLFIEQYNHKLSPFCFYNGNTFAAIGRTMVQELMRSLSPVKAHAFRSVVGHYIAGTAGDEELDQALNELD
jgi:hypothetical protein